MADAETSPVKPALQEKEVSAAAPKGAEASPTSPATPLSLNVLATIREAQVQHGLKLTDYDRYWAHCTRKVHRLRKALGLLQSKGRKYNPKEVTADNAKDTSCAMALKAEAVAEPRKRLHMLKRLRRAEAHARLLDDVCQKLGAACTPQTLLDVQAYHDHLEGLVALEQQHWHEALDAFIRVRAILARLADTGDAEQRALCNARIEEVDPSIRYCAYNLGQLRRSGNDQELTDLIRERVAAQGGPGSALESLTNEMQAMVVGDAFTRGSGVRQIVWGGQTISVDNMKLVELLAQIDQLKAEVQNQGPGEMAMGASVVDGLLSACSDAVAVAQADVTADAAATAKAKSTKSQETSARLKGILAYLSYLRLATMAYRSLGIVAQTLRSLPGEPSELAQGGPTAAVAATMTDAASSARSGRAMAKRKPAKLEDVVRQYDMLMQAR